MLIMKSFFYKLLFVLNLFYFSEITARKNIESCPYYCEKYSWQMNDCSQKKQAAGMTISGVVLFFATGLLAFFVIPTAETVDADVSIPVDKGPFNE